MAKTVFQHVKNLKGSGASFQTLRRKLATIRSFFEFLRSESLVAENPADKVGLQPPETNAPHTAHTTYDVECIIVDAQSGSRRTGRADRPSTALRAGGQLADVFPTALSLMGLEKPELMSGQSLI